LKEIIGGGKSKDVYGNDVLLLDQTQNYWPEPVEAVRRALEKVSPKYIKLILFVRMTRTTPTTFEVLNVFPGTKSP
jgi:hypothetical protein